jgi:hypothetical protein
MSNMPMQAQLDKIDELKKKGYYWDKEHSIAAAGVIMKHRNGDFWLFGLNGEIMHNPKAFISVKI